MTMPRKPLRAVTPLPLPHVEPRQHLTPLGQLAVIALLVVCVLAALGIAEVVR